MENQAELLKEVKAKAALWLSDDYDAETRAAVKAMLEAEDPTDLIESFYKDLEFGTGGPVAAAPRVSPTTSRKPSPTFPKSRWS